MSDPGDEIAKSCLKVAVISIVSAIMILFVGIELSGIVNWIPWI